MDKPPKKTEVGPDGNPLPDFAAQSTVLLQKSEVAALNKTFSYYDTDKSGSLDREEIQYLLSDMSIPVNSPVHQELLEYAMKKFDADESGTLEFDEFQNFLSCFFSWQYIHEFQKSKTFNAEEGTIDGEELAEIIEELGMTENWKEMQDQFDLATVEYDSFLNVIGQVRENRMNTHKQTAGFAPDTLNTIKKNFKKVDRDNRQEVKVTAMCHVLRWCGVLPQSFSEQKRLIDMLSSHQRDGVPAKCMNWEECVQFVRIWLNQVERYEHETRKIVDMGDLDDLHMVRFVEELECAWMSKFFQFPKNEVELLMQYFYVHDIDSSGDIDAVELTDLMQDCGVGHLADRAQELLKEADVNGDGGLDKQEFVALLRKIYDDWYESVYAMFEEKKNSPLFLEDLEALIDYVKNESQENPLSGYDMHRTVTVVKDYYKSIKDSGAIDEIPKDAATGEILLTLDAFDKAMGFVRELRMDDYRNYAGFSPSEIQYYRELFESYDDDNSGSIEQRELIKLLEQMKRLPKNKAEQRRMVSLINSIDRDGNMCLEFEEFLQLCRCWENEAKRERGAKYKKHGMAIGFSGPEVDQFYAVFTDCDEDGSGSVEIDEMMTMFRRLGMSTSNETRNTVLGWISEFAAEESDDEKEGAGVGFAAFLDVMKKVLEAKASGELK